MGLTQMLINEGFQKGMQQGVQKGMQQGVQKGNRQGEISTLKRLLIRRFGAIPAWAEDMMTKAEQKDVDEWTDLILDAKKIEDVFGSSFKNQKGNG